MFHMRIFSGDKKYADELNPDGVASDGVRIIFSASCALADTKIAHRIGELQAFPQGQHARTVEY